MKKLTSLLPLVILGLLLVSGACSSDVSEELPSAVSKFTTQYFPGLGVKSFQELADGGCIVQLSGGPTIRFDSEDQWIDINGNGSALPAVLMYDQLPPRLYELLQGTEQQGEVYVLKRDKYFYTLTLLNTVLTYDIASGNTTYPSESTSK